MYLLLFVPSPQKGHNVGVGPDCPLLELIESGSYPLDLHCLRFHELQISVHISISSTVDYLFFLRNFQ